MKTAIVGSGAMGQLFGAHLVRAGEEVIYLDANPAIIEALNERGVTLHSERGAEHTPARAMRAEELEGEVDLVIVFTKGFHTEAAVASVGHLIGPGTVGLTLQNGLGNAEALEEVFGARRTLLGMTDFPADMREPGIVHTSTEGKVRLGSRAPGAEAERIAAALDAAGLHAAADADIQVPVWEKVAFNAAFNTLSAATGMTVGEIEASPHTRAIIAAVLDEAVAVAASRGVPVSRERIDASVANAYEHHTHHKTSMLLDREAGRRTEIDTIGGAIVRIGAEEGIPTPVLATLAGIVRALTEA
ncbi:MAG: ketopantoate reductase family protein [Leucobacter sp.]